MGEPVATILFGEFSISALAIGHQRSFETQLAQ
jgi:hypothetical protein